VEELSVEERSISPADILAQGRRAIHLLRTPLFTNAFYLWGTAAGAAVAGFAFWALVARLYDADEVGLGSAALSIVTLLAMFSHLGLGTGLIRFLPESGAGGPRLANAVFTTSVVGAVVSSAVFLVGVPLWAPSLDFLREQPLYTLAFISFVIASTLYAVQTYAFMAIRKAKYILVQVTFLQVTRLVLPLMAVSFGAFGIVASGGIATALGAMIGFALLAKGLPGYRPGGVADPASVFKLFPFSLANYVADSLLLTPGLILPLVVVGLLGSTEAAYFYMAWFLGYLLTSASAYLALSLFAEGSYDPGALRVLSRNAVAGALAVAAVGALLLLLLGDRLLLAFGRDYAAEGTTLLRLVALAALPAAVVNVYLGALRVRKQVGELVIIAGAVAVTTVALSSALLPVMGLEGAGVGNGLGQGLGLAIVLARMLTTVEGTMPQRMRWLLVAFAGRS
jgi:O-antigen/teichoic acid export membrane protein